MVERLAEPLSDDFSIKRTKNNGATQDQRNFQLDSYDFFRVKSTNNSEGMQNSHHASGKKSKSFSDRLKELA